MKVKSESEVAQSRPTLRDPMVYSLPGSSFHGIFQARVLEWGAIAFSNIYIYIYIFYTYAYICTYTWGFPGGSEVKASAWNAGDPGLILGSGRSLGEGNGTPLQYSCLENPMDRGAW